MSDTASHNAATASHEEPLFSPVEIEQFATDDVVAGGAIGKMLAALFLYTIFAMCIAGWWTYTSITADRAYTDGLQVTPEIEVHGATDSAH